MSGVERLDLEVDRLRLIDVSSEDDCLLASPSGFSENQYGDDCFDLFEVDDAQDTEGTIGFIDGREVEHVSPESLERGRTNGKCNLRKSLAWDSAFFTNEGVLDPEELSSINNGVTKGDRHPLPGIQEDVRTSAESNFTVNSDNVSLESLEVGLFEDVRASIQRSSKASNVVQSSSNAISGVSALKKAELASRNKVKPILAPKRQSISTQVMDKSPKQAVTAVRARVMQPSASSGVLNASSLRPPKILGRTNPISGTPTTKSSLGPSRIKTENNTIKSASGRGSPTGGLLKKSASGGSSVNARTTALTKSPLGSSPSTKTKTTTSGSPLNSAASNSSDSTGKSPSKIVRNKTVSRNATSVSTSTLKVPVRNSVRSETGPENSRLMAYLKSMPNPSASISPASSIDGWSSESSSSTSTVHQWPNSSRASIAISSPRRGISLERDICSPHTSDLKNRQHDVHSAKRASVGTGSLSHQASANTSKSFKPSGLRLPSPKMGYFDAEKSQSHSPNGSSQIQSQGGTPKTGSGTGNPNEVRKTKLSKFQPARTLAGNGNMKVIPHGGRVVPSTSSPRPSTVTRLHEPPIASPKSSRTVKAKSSDLDSKVQIDSFSETPRRENHLKTGEKELPNVSGGNLESARNEKEIDIPYVSNTSISNDSAIKVISCEKHEPHLSKGISDSHGEYIGSDAIACEKGVQDPGLHENNSQFKTKVHEKENLIRSNDLVDGLTDKMAVMDLKVLDLVKEPIEKVVCHLPSNAVDNLDNPGDAKLTLQDRTLIVPSKDDFQKIASKLNMLSLSPNSMDSRTPLASNVRLLRNKSGPLELGSEPAVETTPMVLPLQESTEKENT